MVRSISLTSSADTIVIGERVFLTASIVAEGAVPEASIRWSAVPNLPLSVDPGHRSAQLVAPNAGLYTITVLAGDRSAHAIL